jgi:hypothetical protein
VAEVCTVNELRKRRMKQITKIVLGVLLLLLVGTDGAQAQRQYFGFKGGWGEGDIRLYPHWTSPPVWGKLNGGFYWVYYGGGKNSAYLADDYTGGICVEVELLQRGFQYAALDRSTKRYTYGREINSIMVPIMWQPHALLLDERLRIFLNAGTTLSYNLNWGSKEFYIENETGEIVDEYDYEWIPVRDNRWGYGLVVGLGAGFRVAEKWEVMMEGRYYFGYSDIVKRKTIYLGTQFLRSPLDNINVSLGVAYCWEHSGSWSFSPAKRRAARMAQTEVLPSGTIVEINQ